MTEPDARPSRDKRPEFMVVLGLSPPYSADDVKQAYFQRAKQLHPDHGGSAHDFQRLHEAFERAQEYVAYRGDRRAWIGAKMESYMEVQEAIERLESIGADVVCDTTDWLQRSIGDFAQLTERVDRVRLVDSPRGDELVAALAELRPALGGLMHLELAGSRVSDRCIPMLGVCQELRSLDLSRTAITSASLAIVDAIPTLMSLNVDGSGVGWWARRRIHAKLRRRRAAGGFRV